METMAKALETRKGLEGEIEVLKKTIAEEKSKVSEDKQYGDQKADEPSADSTATHENTSTSKNAAKARNKVCIC
jgi:hypothetical protein